MISHGTAAIINPALITFVQSAYRHCKPIAAWGDGVEVLAAAGIAPDAPGVVVVEKKPTKAFGKQLLDALAVHRHWERLDPHPTRTPLPDTDSARPARRPASPQPEASKGR